MTDTTPSATSVVGDDQEGKVPVSRAWTQCFRHGCGSTASYITTKTGTLLCSEHAADICDVAVVRRIDAVTHAASTICHGEMKGYKAEARLGLAHCDACKLAWKKYKINLAKREVAA